MELIRRAPPTDLRYFATLMRELDLMLAGQGITFLLTWHLDAFEERFDDCVVVLVGDEKHQIPSYAGRVRAVFKTGGVRRPPLRAALRLDPPVAWRVLLRDLRNLAVAWQRRPAISQTSRAPVYELPMGYFGLIDVPYVPFDDRDVDVFFAGSVVRDEGFTVRPRLASRRRMESALSESRRLLPDLSVDYVGCGPFGSSTGMLDPETYSVRLMRARVALCPRGNFDETFRLVEAAKSGCVLISERLPDRWYYRDPPIIQLDRWSSLPGRLEAMLGDPAELRRRSEQARQWWQTCLSEQAVARFIAGSLPSA